MADRALDPGEIIRLPDPRRAVTAALREVIHDVRGKPARFIRVRLTGWHFPERAPEPFMVIGKTVSQFVRVSPDGLIADGYFADDPEAGRAVEFGYGKVVSWAFPISIQPRRIKRLDRATLPRALQRLLE